MFREAEMNLLADSREEKRIQKKIDLENAIKRAKYKAFYININ
jgi:hypothetical protein